MVTLAVAVGPRRQAVPAVERALCEIEARYGAARREWVMMEMEYPGTTAPCAG